MSLFVINRDTGEEAAMLADDQLDIARKLADRLHAEKGQRWVVCTQRKGRKITDDIVYEAIVYEAMGKR